MHMPLWYVCTCSDRLFHPSNVSVPLFCRHAWMTTIRPRAACTFAAAADSLSSSSFSFGVTYRCGARHRDVMHSEERNRVSAEGVCFAHSLSLDGEVLSYYLLAGGGGEHERLRLLRRQGHVSTPPLPSLPPLFFFWLT